MQFAVSTPVLWQVTDSQVVSVRDNRHNDCHGLMNPACSVCGFSRYGNHRVTFLVADWHVFVSVTEKSLQM